MPIYSIQGLCPTLAGGVSYILYKSFFFYWFHRPRSNGARVGSEPTVINGEGGCLFSLFGFFKPGGQLRVIAFNGGKGEGQFKGLIKGFGFTPNKPEREPRSQPGGQGKTNIPVSSLSQPRTCAHLHSQDAGKQKHTSSHLASRCVFQPGTLSVRPRSRVPPQGSKLHNNPNASQKSFVIFNCVRFYLIGPCGARASLKLDPRAHVYYYSSRALGVSAFFQQQELYFSTLDIKYQLSRDSTHS